MDQARDDKIAEITRLRKIEQIKALREQEATAPKVSPLESGLRGAAQGASLGFADEAAGGLDYLKEGLGQIAKGGMLSDSDKLGSTYSEGRDESRANYDAAQKANPGTFLAGNLAGSLALPTGSLGLAKGAALGAAQGLGSSDRDSLGGLAADTALGAGLGGVVGAGTSVVGKGLNKAAELGSDVLEGSGNIAKDTASWLANRATNSTSGRSALDSGLIRAGDNAADISLRANANTNPFLDSLRTGVREKATKEAAEPFFSDADKMGIASSLMGGPHAAAAATTGLAGKNLINSRGASTGAVALDSIGDILTQAPERLGKFAKPLQDAQARGALNPTLFILQQTNPEFRKLVYPEQ